MTATHLAHRIVAGGLSTRTVHEALANDTFDDLIANVPDEFHPWLRGVSDDLITKHDDILRAARSDLHAARFNASAGRSTTADFIYNRKELAEQITKNARYPGLCFALEDGRDPSPRIWQMIRPERETAMIIGIDN